MYKNDPARVRVLLETMRIVLHGLPFRMGEYEETRILEAIAVEEKLRLTLHAKQVTHSIVELYSASKKEVVKFLQTRRKADGKCFGLQADFWCAKAKKAKYLGKYMYFRVFCVWYLLICYSPI